MGNSAVKRHYETAGKTGVFNLSGRKLREFPKQLYNLSSTLRNLDLSDNQITTIPANIKDFKCLKSITINNNTLTSLPDEIGCLIKLETISFVGNNLQHLPSTISQLVNLKYVHLACNQITEFPISLCVLRHVDLVDLSNNLIEKIPAGIGELRAIELNLNQNRISFVSEQIADCPCLRTLRLEENCLQLASIPKRLLLDSTITLLALEGNLFAMKNFADLDGYDTYMERYTAVKKKM